MATYNQGILTAMLTAEGAAKANELNARGITVKVSHMRIYRTPTPVQEIPYSLTGLEDRNTLSWWSALPNADARFDVIENYPTVPTPGYLTLIGTLGADVGTFSYDAVGLFLEDDTLYAICVTSRLLTKRKAALGGTSNIQELSFNVYHTTVPEVVDFRIDEKMVDYSKITEVEYPHLLPKKSDPERIYRLTSGYIKTYTGEDAFATTLATQTPLPISGSDLSAPVWLISDYLKLFNSDFLDYTLQPDNKVSVTVPTSKQYPAELLTPSGIFLLSLIDPTDQAKYSVLRLALESNTTDVSGCTFVFNVQDISLELIQAINLKGILFTRSDDSIYHNAVKTALKQMAEIQYSMGRRFKADSLISPDTILDPLWGRESKWIKLDNRLEISTSIYDSRLYASGMVQPVINKSGATKHMKLRASNIWVNREQEGVSPTLTVDRMVLIYGQIATATVSAPGLKDGSRVAWYVKSPRTNGLVEPRVTYGYVEIQNGVGTFEIKPNWVVVKDKDSIAVGLVGYPDQDTLVMIKQLVLTSYFSTDPDGIDRITQADEGATVYFNVESTDQLEVDVILYLRSAVSSSVNGNDFNQSLPDYLTLRQKRGFVPLMVREDDLTEGGESLILQVALTSSFPSILTYAGLNINDTSISRNPTYQMYFAYDINGDNPIPAGTPIGLGTGTIYLIVKAQDVPTNHPVTIEWSGSLDLTNDVTMAIPNPLNMTLVNGFGSYPISTYIPKLSATDPGGTWEVKELSITANRFTTFSMYDEVVKTFGVPKSNWSIKLTINEGVFVIGTNTSVPAIDCTGGWPAGIPISIENSGFILGRGGQGGYIERTTAYDGSDGGFAILAQPANPVTVTNNGTVAGGGGGSGAAFTTYSETMDGTTLVYGIIQSGSGGRPLGLGNTGSIGPNGYVNSIKNGGTATLTDPGTSPEFINQDALIGAMSGGDLAQAGNDGKGSIRNSKGGQPGLRSYGPVVITGGTILGNAG